VRTHAHTDALPTAFGGAARVAFYGYTGAGAGGRTFGEDGGMLSGVEEVVFGIMRREEGQYEEVGVDSTYGTATRNEDKGELATI